MSRSTAQKMPEISPSQDAVSDVDGIDAVLSDNARRLRAIVHKWRDQDGARRTALPIARRSGDATAQTQPADFENDAAAAAIVDADVTATHSVAAQVRTDGVETPSNPPSAEPTETIPQPRSPDRRIGSDRARPATSVPRPEPPADKKQDGTKAYSVLSEPEPNEQRATRSSAAETGSATEMPAKEISATSADPVRGPRKARAATPKVVARDVAAEPASKHNDRGDAAPHAEAPPTTLTPPPVHKLAKKGEMWLALIASRRAITAVGWFSCVINVLMLAGPLFMLQVYDRVMTSGSVPTLLALLGLTTAVYAFIGVLELVRSRTITRIGIEIDQRIGDRIFEASLKSSIGASGSPVAALRDLDTLRNFVAGPAPMTFFDAWWAPVYLLVIFATHWLLGFAALGGCALLLLTAYLSDSRSRAPLLEGQKAAVRGMEMAETGQRNAETIAAMGMIGDYRQRWQKLNREALEWQIYASDVLGGISSVSKTLRLLLQSVMLAIGAALALKGEISSGSIIASTIIFGRALAPVEQVITHWRNSLKALDAYKKLEALLAAVPAMERGVRLPAPKGRLQVAGLRVAAPNSKQLILNNVSFAVEPGQMLAVIGPSASGKSSLTKALVGLWPPFGGSIKLDEVEINRWNSEDLGKHIGYLPQDMELFSGTVRENIARFRADATDEQVIAAATAAHAHELVMSLPSGYATELGAFGTHLSGGQRQRIALARALFGNPALVVLDEANANLDRAGDMALSAAIDDMRKRGQSIIFVSHRVQAIQQADTLLYLDRGVQKAFGPRADVMAMINGGGARDGRVQSQQSAPQQPTTASASPRGVPAGAPGRE